MRIELALLRLDPVLLQIEAEHGEMDPAPLVRDLAQPARDPVLLRIEGSLQQTDLNSQHLKPDSHHPEPSSHHLEPAHRVRERERRVRDLHSHHPGLDSHQFGPDSHHGDPDLMQKQGEMLRIDLDLQHHAAEVCVK